METKKIEKKVLIYSGIAIAILVLIGALVVRYIYNSDEEARSDDLMDSIGFSYALDPASPEKNYEFQNDKKTVVYTIHYLEDTTAERAAATFENGKENLEKEQTTWDQVLYKYNLYCYENCRQLADSIVEVFSADKVADTWKYVEKKGKSTTETMFFDRADGCYCVTMTYPSKNDVARCTLYHIAIRQDFQVDNANRTTWNHAVTWEESWDENNQLVITAENRSDLVVPEILCRVETDSYALLVESKYNVQPGETVEFKEKEMEQFLEEGTELKDLRDCEYYIDMHTGNIEYFINLNGEFGIVTN